MPRQHHTLTMHRRRKKLRLPRKMKIGYVTVASPCAGRVDFPNGVIWMYGAGLPTHIEFPAWLSPQGAFTVTLTDRPYEFPVEVQFAIGYVDG